MKRILYFVVTLLIAQTTLASNKNANTSAPNTKKFDVVIVGGGFSGLTAAHYLKNKNILVLEKEAIAGGRCISGHWNGFHYPKGTEYIGKPEQPLKKVIRKLGIKASKIPAPTDGVSYNGKFYFGKELLDFLNPSELKQYDQLNKELYIFSKNGIEDAVFWDQNELDKYKTLDKISVKEWLDKHSYPNIIQQFIDIENRGLFGTDNSNFSMLFNIPEMAFDLPNVNSINKSEVYSFNEGMYSMITEFCNELGNKLICGATVNKVNTRDSSTVEVIYTKNGVKQKVYAKTVIMATPAPITAKILEGELSNKAFNTLNEIKYSTYATINFFTKTRLLKETWSVSCINEGQVVTLYDAIRPQVDENYSGKSILSVYMAPEHAYDSNFSQQSDQEFLDNAYKTLNKHYPDFEEQVLGYDINRFQYAFPVFSPNYNKKLQVLLNNKSVNGPIFLAGDYMVYATVDGAMLSAEKAVEKVKEYLEEN